MSSAYFAPLVTKPVVITGAGRYRTRCGEVVVVNDAPAGIRHHAFDCFGRYATGEREQWHRSGRLYASRECSNDIVGSCDA